MKFTYVLMDQKSGSCIDNFESDINLNYQKYDIFVLSDSNKMHLRYEVVKVRKLTIIHSENGKIFRDIRATVWCNKE